MPKAMVYGCSQKGFTKKRAECDGHVINTDIRGNVTHAKCKYKSDDGKCSFYTEAKS